MLLIFYFILEYSWLTMLRWFHIFSKVIQLYIYMYIMEQQTGSK